MRSVRPHLLSTRTAFVVLAWASLAWANSAPVVSNVTASQRTDGSKKVDIRYTLADADNDACTVSLLASNDGGSTWAVSVTAVTGAVDAGVTPGTARLIVWDCKVDLPGTFGSQFKVRVCADDGHAPTGMVLIPAGEFLMGDSFYPREGNSDELPRHAVTVDAFFMDKNLVTNQQYADALNWANAQGNLITVTSGRVYKYNSGTSYPYCDTTTSYTYSQITWSGSTFGVVSGKGNYPMERVSWYGSVAYANWRSGMQTKPPCYDLSTWNCNFGSGYRLPTEAEWEKAARGGASRPPVPVVQQRLPSSTPGRTTTAVRATRTIRVRRAAITRRSAREALPTPVRWGISRPTATACTTWRATYGSGATTGTAGAITAAAPTTTRTGRRAETMAAVFCAAAVGATMPASAGLRSASPTARMPTTAFSASVVRWGLRNTLFSWSLALFSRRAKMAKDDLLVIDRTYELVKWFLGHLGKFPRSHRYGLGQRIETRLYTLFEGLVRVKYASGPGKVAALAAVNEELELVRMLRGIDDL